MERPHLLAEQRNAVWVGSASRTGALWAGRGCGVLLGAAAALGFLVAAEGLYGPGLPRRPIPYHVIVVYLFWAALGAWVPQQLIITAVRGTLARFWARQRPAVEPRLHLLAGRDDQAVDWLIVGSLVGAGGAVQLLLMALVTAVIHLNAFLQTHFLWMPMTWGVVQVLLMGAIFAVPGMLLGVTVSAWIAAVRVPGYKIPPWAFTLLLAGSALGVGLWARIGSVWAGRTAGFLLPALVYFAASVLGFFVSSLRTAGTPAESVPRIDPPDCISRDRYLVGVGLMIWAAVVTLWIVEARPVPRQLGGILLMRPGLFAVSILVAALAGEARMARRRFSRGGAGVAIWALGLANVLGVGVAGASLQWIQAVLPIIQMAAWAVTGFTLPYLVRCLMLRYSSRSLGQSLAITFLFAGGAGGTILAGSAVALHKPLQQMALFSALAAVAVGGTLVIHEPQTSGRRRRIRLAMVFAGILGVMSVFGSGVLG